MDEAREWQWDAKGGFWFRETESDMGPDELSPQKLMEDYRSLLAELEQAEVERDGWRNYATHTYLCSSKSNHECDCGFDSFQASLRED